MTDEERFTSKGPGLYGKHRKKKKWRDEINVIAVTNGLPVDILLVLQDTLDCYSYSTSCKELSLLD